MIFLIYKRLKKQKTPCKYQHKESHLLQSTTVDRAFKLCNYGQITTSSYSLASKYNLSNLNPYLYKYLYLFAEEKRKSSDLS